MTFFDRGYTGHEHLQGVGLINMNARLYDAKLHRFLQADSILQDPSNTQNYNKYGYCVNNPLRHTDFSGNIFGFDDVLVCALIYAAIGALVGTAVYVGTNLYFGTPITAGGIIGAFVMGAISGAVSFGIGEAVSSIAQFGVRITVQALAHGVFQGGLSYVQSGNFASGFISGALSSIACSAWSGGKLAGGDGMWGGIGGNFAKGGAGTLFFGALAGGVGASLGGGNFWQGAVTGLFVAGMNHLAVHQGQKIDAKKSITERLIKAGYPVPSAAADYLGLDLNAFASIVFPDMMQQAKNPKFQKVDVILESNGDTTDELGRTKSSLNLKTKLVTFKGPVLIAKAAFSSFLQLASTVGHELTHVTNIFNGNMNKWMRKGEVYALAKSEVESYGWEFDNGGVYVAERYFKNLSIISNFK
jgi:RHS repeat-associated protein